MEKVRFAYFRDPEEEQRVVTFAWRDVTNAEQRAVYGNSKSMIRYSYAINKVTGSVAKPWKKRVVDQHNKKVARAITAGRLESPRYVKDFGTDSDKVLDLIISHFFSWFLYDIKTLKRLKADYSLECFVRNVLEQLFEKCDYSKYNSIDRWERKNG